MKSELLNESIVSHFLKDLGRLFTQPHLMHKSFIGAAEVLKRLVALLKCSDDHWIDGLLSKEIHERLLTAAALNHASLGRANTETQGQSDRPGFSRAILLHRHEARKAIARKESRSNGGTNHSRSNHDDIVGRCNRKVLVKNIVARRDDDACIGFKMRGYAFVEELRLNLAGWSTWVHEKVRITYLVGDKQKKNVSLSSCCRPVIHMTKPISVGRHRVFIVTICNNQIGGLEDRGNIECIPHVQRLSSPLITIPEKHHGLTSQDFQRAILIVEETCSHDGEFKMINGSRQSISIQFRQRRGFLL